jgi:type I restriction enzyme S subunit
MFNGDAKSLTRSGATNQQLNSVIPNSNHAGDFIYYALSHHAEDIAKLAGRHAVPIVNKSLFSSVKMLAPKLPEQQRIAECLTTLDEVIAAQRQKLDALKTHKKGLMQQLFPREGETLPRLRFPEFLDAPEWVENNLGSVGDVLMCKRIFSSDTSDSGDVPFYKIGTLGKEPDAFISQELFENYKSRYNFPRFGEVLITCSGTVGKCLPYDGRDGYYQDSNIVWIDNPSQEVSNDFLLRILTNVNWSKLNSTTITRIYGPDLKGLLIRFPADPDEQQRIASCLTSLDDLVTAQSTKLDSLKTHKKGLMQQLFPSPEEVEA